MASNVPDVTYCCEICGLESLSEDEFRVHTHTAHVDGHAVCPFCQLGSISPSELLLHVNQAHLDFLTPESEMNMSFIDDTSPDYNGECSAGAVWNDNVVQNGTTNGSLGHNINNINIAPKVVIYFTTTNSCFYSNSFLA